MSIATEVKLPIQTGILTVSDSCFNKEANDGSGNNLQVLVDSKSLFNGEVCARRCVPDDASEIQLVIKEWSDDKHFDLILTTGGTGFTEKDVTPEATWAVIDREAPGMSIAMIEGSLKITPFAMLSRPVCGIRHKTLIINLPGSQKGSEECLQLVAPAIPHAIDQLRGHTKEVAQTHKLIQHSSCDCSHVSSKVDVTQVARRARHSPYPIIPVDEAQKIILNESYILDTEYVMFKDALGYVLADDIFALYDLPPFPASIKDGYAVLTSNGEGNRNVVGDSTAGVEPNICMVTSGNCVRISTGAPVPAGADAVVQVEDTELLHQTDDGKTELKINILVAPKLGQDIRPIGSDIQKNEMILAKQMKLGPAELGILAAVGPTNIAIYRRPIISVLSTGNEIAEPTDTPLKEGYIRDSNKTTLLSLFRSEGFIALDEGIARDNPEDLKNKLENMLKKSDVLVTTGGVSMGEKDYLKQVLDVDFKAKIHFGRVFMKPGKPTTFATLMYKKKKKLVFSLPGNPVSATVTCHLFVFPAIKKLSGYLNPMPTIIRAKLAKNVKLDPRPEYHRAYLTWETGSPIPYAVSTGNQISSRLPSMHKANVLLMLPPRSDKTAELKEEDFIDALVIDKI